MTAATPGPSGASPFSIFSGEGEALYRAKRETFVCSMLGQALVVRLLVCCTSYIAHDPSRILRQVPEIRNLIPVAFSRPGGGGGGDFDQHPASHGVLPRTSLNDQLTPPTVIVPKEMPKLAVDPTVMVAPEIKLAQGVQVGDPMAQISNLLSNARVDLEASAKVVAGESVRRMDLGRALGPEASMSLGREG
jgi:hypothetical protein